MRWRIEKAKVTGMGKGQEKDRKCKRVKQKERGGS